MTPEYILILAVMLAGMALSAMAFRNALRDRRALIDSGSNGVRWVVVMQGLRHEFIHLVKHLVLISAVWWSQGMVVSGGVWEILLARNFFSVVISLLITADSLWDVRDWRRIRRINAGEHV